MVNGRKTFYHGRETEREIERLCVCLRVCPLSEIEVGRHLVVDVENCFTVT